MKIKDPRKLKRCIETLNTAMKNFVWSDEYVSHEFAAYGALNSKWEELTTNLFFLTATETDIQKFAQELYNHADKPIVDKYIAERSYDCGRG